MTPKMKLLLRVTFAITVATVLAVPSIYLLLGQSEIAVEEGSASYTFTGNFFNTSGQTPSFSNLNTTTTIAEKGFSDFALHASMSGYAFGEESNVSLLYFSLSLQLKGNLSFNLHPTGLDIAVAPLSNSTSTFRTYFGRSVTQHDTNTAYDLIFQKSDNVSSSGGGLNLNLALLNDTNLRPTQTFNFSVWDIITNLVIPANSSIGIPIQYNTTYGISVTASLEGLSEPVSTTLYLFFIDVP